MSTRPNNSYECDKLQHETGARKRSLHKHQAFKNIIAHQIILCEHFNVNKETFFSPVMGPNLFPKIFIYYSHHQ
jgi:hypothetical protein